MNKGSFSWPNGERIAITVSAMFETWSEGKPPPYGVQATALKPGAVDHGGISWGTYGGHVGAFRIANVLRDAGAPCTFGVNARCAELYPEAVKYIVKAGHDIAAHGYYQDQLLTYMDPAEELATIRKSRDILERTTGMRPDGWFSSVLAWTEHTSEFLAQEGFRWQGDATNIDLPRVVHTKNGDIAYVPASDFSDNRVLRSSPMDYYDVYKETFHYLYRYEAPAYMSLTLHCHFGGRPMVMAIVHKLFRYFAQFPDVWFARHRDIGEWVLKEQIEAETHARRIQLRA